MDFRFFKKRITLENPGADAPCGQVDLPPPEAEIAGWNFPANIRSFFLRKEGPYIVGKSQTHEVSDNQPCSHSVFIRVRYVVLPVRAYISDTRQVKKITAASSEMAYFVSVCLSRSGLSIKKTEDRIVFCLFCEPKAGLEPATYSLRMNCSTN